MRDLRPNRLQVVLATIAVTTYALGVAMDDLHTAHALWVLTVCAVVGVIAAGNVTCVISRIVDALTPLLIRIVQLEREQLDAMEKQVVQDGQGAQAQPNEDWKARHLN